MTYSAWASEYASSGAPYEEFGSEDPNDCILACLMGMGLPLLLRKALDDRMPGVVLAALKVRVYPACSRLVS